MTESTTEYLEYVDELIARSKENTQFERTEEYDVIIDTLNKLWLTMTMEEHQFVKEKLKEKGPGPTVVTRADLGLNRK